MRRFERKLSYGAGALVLVAMAGSAEAGSTEAQDASPGTEVVGEDIIVTGRTTVAAPVEQIKHDSAAITDSVTSTEIEKTGDLTLAESLERLPGVSSTGFFSSSDVGYVNIRGFRSVYNSIDVDGNPITFTSQNNRGSQIGLIPSIVVNEATVFKTVTVDMDQNSIGGHISLRTLRAFDGGTRPYFKAGARVGFSEQDSRIHDGPSSQIYAAGKFTFGPDHRFGAVFGVSRQRTADRDALGSVTGYSQVKGADGALRDVINGNVFDHSAVDKETRNMAVFAKLEARVEDQLYAFVSANFYDETKNYHIQRAGPFIAPSGGRSVTLTGTGQGMFTNGQGQVREFDYEMQRRAKVFGTGMDLRFLDRGSLILRGGYTDYDNDVFTRNIGAGFRLNGINGAYDVTGNAPQIVPIDRASYDDPAKWAFSNTANTSSSAAYLRYQPLRDDIYNLGATLNWNNQARAEGFGAQTGINWVRLDRTFDQANDYYALKSGVTLNLAQVVPPGSSMFGNRAAMNSYDPFWAFMVANGESRRDEALTTDYRLREDTLGLFAAASYVVGGLKMTTGLRYEWTSDVTDTGEVVSGVAGPLHRSKKTGNWLPNLRLSYDASPQFKMRAALTKAIGKPDFSSFAPGTTTSFDANGVTIISGSNADIGPRKVTSYDASVEYYLRDGMLSLGLFNKEFRDEIFTQRSEIRDANGELTEIRTQPINTGSARVRGVEVTAIKRHLDFLPAPLSRFGISGNFTWLDGESSPIFTDGTTRTVDGFAGQPKWMANLRVGYDAGPLDLNANFRSQGRTFSSFGIASESDAFIRPYSQLDLQARLAVYHKASLTFDARNVANTYQISTEGIEDSLTNSIGAGRSYWLGLRFSY